MSTTEEHEIMKGTPLSAAHTANCESILEKTPLTREKQSFSAAGRGAGGCGQERDARSGRGDTMCQLGTRDKTPAGCVLQQLTDLVASNRMRGHLERAMRDSTEMTDDETGPGAICKMMLDASSIDEGKTSVAGTDGLRVQDFTTDDGENGSLEKRLVSAEKCWEDRSGNEGRESDVRGIRREAQAVAGSNTKARVSASEGYRKRAA